MKKGQRRRDRLEIMMDILTFCKEPRKKTHIVLSLGICSDSLKPKLKELLSRELLDSRRRLFQTTKQGYRLLYLWKEFLGAYQSSP